MEHPASGTRRRQVQSTANFGPNTKASVQAFQTWGGVAADGIVGYQTWTVSLRVASATLETAVGLQYAT
jgi:peptidoglycan hydrolase-like protein with peptidoglycan-binding domain